MTDRFIKTKLALVCVLCFATNHYVISQTDHNSNRSNFAGINPAHTIILQAVSKVMDADVSYLPIHIHFNHAFSRHFGISGMGLYRLDKDGPHFLTHEFGFAAGPAYLSNSLNGFYADLKIGFGYAFGTDYNNSDYTRSDLIIEPDIGYYLNFSSGFSIALGIGMQSLIKLWESYYGYVWEWNSTGKLSHYYLPVVNVSLGFKI